MQYSSGPTKKMDYARFIAASLFYLAIRNQRDAAGLIVFDDEVRDYVRPSTRQGQLARLFAALERPNRTPALNSKSRCGISRSFCPARYCHCDFRLLRDPTEVVRPIERCVSMGTRCCCSTFSIGGDTAGVKGSAILIDSKTDERIEVVPNMRRLRIERK